MPLSWGRQPRAQKSKTPRIPGLSVTSHVDSISQPPSGAHWHHHVDVTNRHHKRVAVRSASKLLPDAGSTTYTTISIGALDANDAAVWRATIECESNDDQAGSGEFLDHPSGTVRVKLKGSVMSRLTPSSHTMPMLRTSWKH